jgi:hypothetical protein
MSKTDTETTNKRLQELMSKSLTGALPLIITDTVANTNINAYAIYALEDTTFTTLQIIAEGNSLTTETLSKGHIWYVPINGTVTLATGAVIIYQHTPSGN